MALLTGRLCRTSLRACLLILVIVPGGSALGQESRWPRQARRVLKASPAPCDQCVTPTLGTFEPTPYVMVRGNWPAGGGYSPLGVYGDQSMSLYGPLSPLRSTSAPVTIYRRGYNGNLEAGRGTAFSTPNLPALSPVVYPRPSNYYYAPRVDRTPPSWSSGMNWIDQ
jgi:hypothetical protein